MESPIRIAFISCLSRLDKTAFLWRVAALAGTPVQPH
jgi:hypothetical protein